MSAFCQRSYHKNVNTGGQGVKKSQSLVNVVCERPLVVILRSRLHQVEYSRVRNKNRGYVLIRKGLRLTMFGFLFLFLSFFFFSLAITVAGRGKNLPIFFDLPEQRFKPQIFSKFPTHNLNVSVIRSNLDKQVKISRLYLKFQNFLSQIEHQVLKNLLKSNNLCASILVVGTIFLKPNRDSSVFCMYLVPITLATDWKNWWVNQQCNLDPETVPQVLLYFPIVILIVAVSLFLVEKFYDVAFQVGDEAKNFYELLVNLKVLDKKGKKKP